MPNFQEFKLNYLKCAKKKKGKKILQEKTKLWIFFFLEIKGNLQNIFSLVQLLLLMENCLRRINKHIFDEIQYHLGWILCA